MLESLINGLLGSCGIVLMACAITTHYKAARYLDFSLASIVTVGGYTAYVAAVRFQLPLALSLLVASLIGALIGLGLQAFALAPLHERRASRSILLLTSLGLYIVVVNLLGVVFGSSTRVPRPGVESTLTFFDVATPIIRWELLLGTAVALFIVSAGLRLTRVSRLLNACFDAPELIETCGHNRASLRAIAVGIAALLCGIAGAVIATDTGVQPASSLSLFLFATVSAIAGGLGNTTGAIVTALIFSLVRAFAALVIPGQWIDTVALFVILALLAVKPNGLMSPTGARVMA